MEREDEVGDHSHGIDLGAVTGAVLVGKLVAHSGKDGAFPGVGFVRKGSIDDSCCNHVRVVKEVMRKIGYVPG